MPRETLDEKLIRWEREDQERLDKIQAERDRRGKPWRFILRGVQVHHLEWEENGQIVRDSSWTLPEIDPSPEKDEVIEVVEAKAYDDAIEFLKYLHENLKTEFVEDGSGLVHFHTPVARLRKKIEDYLEGNYEANSA